jgi:dTDP-glucose 4,6-dehydratase
LDSLKSDLEELLQRTKPEVWERLRGARVFITGGTGFFGKWILESWAHANRKLDLGGRATVLARNPDKFRAEFPHLASEPSITFLKGDLLGFAFPATPFTHILHAATPASVALDREEPKLMRETIVEGTARILELARAQRSPPRVLFISSGAVYGVQPPALHQVPEDYDPPTSALPDSAYAHGKRAAEQLCQKANAGGIPCIIARCFAFAGPHLPLDGHYAFGNFIRDARNGGPIRIAGDGTPFRSYLYAGELPGWLWTTLTLGKPGRAYNIGSSNAVSIEEIARAIARFYDVEVQIAQKPVAGKPPPRYVPSTERARHELGLEAVLGLEEIIARTDRFLGAFQGSS